jgi:hypothetical protein
VLAFEVLVEFDQCLGIGHVRAAQNVLAISIIS